MRRSDERILVTHVGSLPRNPALSDLLIRNEAGEAIDQRASRGTKRSQSRPGTTCFATSKMPYLPSPRRKATTPMVSPVQVAPSRERV